MAKKKEHVTVRFGKKVRAEREARNISQERLGQLAKMHRTYIGMIERAEKNITISNVEKLAKALGMGMNELMDL